MRSVLRLAPFLLILSFCAPLAAQISPIPGIGNRRARYSVSGTLRDESNNREMDGVKVDLRMIGGQTISTAFTGFSGDFAFGSLEAGQYYLVVEQNGYESLNQAVAVQEVSVFGLQLWLRKPSAPNAGPMGPIVSARELSIPHKAHDLMQKGLSLLYEKSDFRGSIEQFQRAIKEYPNYYEAYAQMGVAYMDLRDTANSEQALHKSIDMSEQHYPDAYVMLATLYSNEKRFADAEPVARKATELDDNSWQAHYELGRALYGLKRDAEAEPNAQAATQLQPDRADLRLLMANIHVRLHKYPLVLEDLNGYLKLEPNGAMADQVRRLRDQVQQALEKAQAAAADDSDAPSTGQEDAEPK